MQRMNVSDVCDKRGYHRVIKDSFSEMPGVKRLIPGNCKCLDCGLLLAANFNGGKPYYLADKKDK